MTSFFAFISRQIVFKGIVVLLLITLLLLHAWKINVIPDGLYIDETSIGLNAASIEHTLRDEHGVFMPVFFEAFGEYKNPLYIYTTSIIFIVLGISETSLRLTSTLYYLIYVVGFLYFIHTVFPKNKLMLVFGLLTAGLTPWFFTLSRISFEVITQPAIMIWALVVTYRAMHENQGRSKLIYPLISGLLIGLSIYSYTTSRLLAFGLIASIFALYHSRIYWHRLALIATGFSIALLPYLLFSVFHPGALTARLSVISFIYDQHLSISQKMEQIWLNYLSYFDPAFLVLHGDQNLRHHTGYTGELLFATAILAVIGFYWMIYRQEGSGKKIFELLLILQLFLAPIAAAVTEPGHSLRSLLFGFYILVISLYGFELLQRLAVNRLVKSIALAMVLILLTAQGILYVNNYFSVYASKTTWAFESSGFKPLLQEAIELHPSQIIISANSNQPYAHLEFYHYLVTNEKNIPIYVSVPTPQPHTCLMTFISEEDPRNGSALMPHYERITGYTRLQCY